MDRFYDDRLRLNRVTSSADALPFDYSYTDNSSRNLVDSVAQWVGTSTRYCRTYDYESQSDRLSALQHSWGTLAASTVDTRLAYDSVGLRSNESTAGSGLMASLGRTSGLCTDFTYTPRRELDTSGQYDLSAVWARGLAIASSLRAYGYDAIGNRVADQAGAYAANALNQYTSAPGIAALAYDLAGNLTSDGSRTYTYDGENRLASITQGGVTSTFKYDYLGRRISKNVGGAETRYLYDGWALIAEIAPGSFAIQRSYTWGLDASGSLQGAGGVGGLLCIASGASRYYPIYDASFNVTGLYDGNGAIAAAYRYDPSGNLLQATGAAAALNPFGFSTKFTDRETGLIYYGLRYYHAALGRFINRDPIEERGGLNLYGFCGNDGVNRWDYLGMEDDDEVVKLPPFEVTGGSEEERRDYEAMRANQQAIDSYMMDRAIRDASAPNSAGASGEPSTRTWFVSQGQADALVAKYGRYLRAGELFGSREEAILNGAFLSAMGTGYARAWDAKNKWYYGEFADKSYFDFEHIWGVKAVGDKFQSTRSVTEGNQTRIAWTAHPEIVALKNNRELDSAGHNHPWTLIPWGGGSEFSSADYRVGTQLGVPFYSIGSDGEMRRDGVVVPVPGVPQAAVGAILECIQEGYIKP